LSVLFLKLQTGKQKQTPLKRKEVRQSCLIRRWKQPCEIRRNRDKWQRKNTSQGKQEARFDNGERDSKKRRKMVRKLQTDCWEKSGGETYCLVSMDRYLYSVAIEVWVQCTQCQVWAHEKCTVGVSWDVFFPTASRMYQMEISDVLWT
jgi:hypothetical protein